MAEWPYTQLSAIEAAVSQARRDCDQLDPLTAIERLSGLGDPISAAIGELAEIALNDQRVSQRKVAAAIGVSPSTLGRWLR